MAAVRNGEAKAKVKESVGITSADTRRGKAHVFPTARAQQDDRRSTRLVPLESEQTHLLRIGVGACTMEADCITLMNLLVRSGVRRRQIGVCNVDVHIVSRNAALAVVNRQSHHDYITSARHSRRRECRRSRVRSG